MDGDVFSFLERYFKHCGGPLDENLTKAITKQLLQGLQFIHKKGIIHRDIKLENLLIEILNRDEVSVKITDFGMAQYLNPDDDKMNMQAGSSSYIAPEVLSWGPLTEKSDVWSAAIVTYILMQGAFPFDGNNFDQVYTSIMLKDLNKEWSSAKWSHISQDAKDFLNLCFTKDPKMRPSCSDLLNHQWFKQTK